MHTHTHAVRFTSCFILTDHGRHCHLPICDLETNVNKCVRTCTCVQEQGDMIGQGGKNFFHLCQYFPICLFSLHSLKHITLLYKVHSAFQHILLSATLYFCLSSFQPPFFLLNSFSFLSTFPLSCFFFHTLLPISLQHMLSYFFLPVWEMKLPIINIL